MLRHLPKFTYNGLTIVLSNPSRFDTQELLSAAAGFWFGKDCLAPECNRHQCEIRTRFYKGPLLLGTKVVLLMGEDAAHDWLPEIRDNKIGEVRGSCYTKDGVIYIPTFVAQDACDMKDYEGKLNPLLQEEGGNTRDWLDAEDEGSVKSAVAEKRRHGVTSRANYRFWIRNDVKKALRIIYEHNGQIPNLYPGGRLPNYIIYPHSDVVLASLLSTTGTYLDFDMETFGNLDISCFSFSFGESSDVYVVPIRDGTFQLAYDPITVCHILRALAVAISRNTLVAHNGSGFDYYVLAHRYKIPIGRKVFDTMLAWHRCIKGETQVDTVSGKVMIKDLVGKENFLVWSWKNGKPFPAKVIRVFKTSNKQKVVKVNCWRRKFGGTEQFSITCTPDHKFLVGGNWVEAKDLTPKTSLTKVCINYSGDYFTLRDWTEGYLGDNGITYKAHRYIYEALVGPIPKHHEIHHKDLNKFNNELNNLECLHESEHRSIHGYDAVQSLIKHNKENGPWNKGQIAYDLLSVDKVKELYEAGMSQINIAKHFNVDQGQISRLMKKHGIKTRTLDESQKLRRQNEKNCKVISVEYLDEEIETYCMDVEDTHCFSCEGVIVHNCYPEIEKSLGHVISALTFENFHKDEGTFVYGSPQQAMNLWRYCGKDVWTMKLIRREILKLAAGKRGLLESIEQVMASVRPYLTTTLTGIRYDQSKIIEIMSENDRMMSQHLRLIKLLVGDVFLPTSPPQCINYFHKQLGYPVVGRTKTGAPSLGEKQMLQLRLKQENPVIDTCLAYRQTKKESGSLKFIPYKEMDNIL